MTYSARSTWAKRLSLCLMLCALSGCATVSTALVPANSYCSIAQPLDYDTVKDSPETVTAIEIHNSKWVCLCELECPAGITP